MTKINVQPDCGNAPRKLYLKDFNVALAKGDIEFFKKNIHENITWELVGASLVKGKENYLKALVQYKLWKVKQLTIDTIITHGPDASVSGRLITADNSQFNYCDIYKFKSAGGTTIHSIKSFLLPEL